MIRRGDVVMVRFPFTDVPGGKVRPALIVQNDRDNQRLHKTVIAMITGNLRRLADASHLLIDPATPEGLSSGLKVPSLVSCNNLFTLEQKDILRSIGHLSDVLMARLNDCLKSALEVS